MFQAWVKTAELSPLLTPIMGLQLYLFMGVVKMSVWNCWWPTYATEDEANKERKHRLCRLDLDLFLATLDKLLDQASG